MCKGLHLCFLLEGEHTQSCTHAQVHAHTHISQAELKNYSRDSEVQSPPSISPSVESQGLGSLESTLQDRLPQWKERRLNPCNPLRGPRLVPLLAKAYSILLPGKPGPWVWVHLRGAGRGQRKCQEGRKKESLFALPQTEVSGCQPLPGKVQVNHPA